MYRVIQIFIRVLKNWKIAGLPEIEFICLHVPGTRN